eukprot:CAMPEP_0115839478 /NCGR_PEP_ID=MMETSP0287-20121206/6275_1 /TAXON_ID=412157 /ORGANISM="Chrysochromulina rotalis, Strain UIO044" /LENGTH=132 /DNA_ID=CAMNT_0003293057 /DNA_START=662 /DNA_END=1056 /DNA_ORIENTATION=+
MPHSKPTVQDGKPMLQRSPVEDSSESNSCDQPPPIELFLRLQDQLANAIAGARECCCNGYGRGEAAHASAVEHAREVNSGLPCGGHLMRSEDGADRHLLRCEQEGCAPSLTDERLREERFGTVLLGFATKRP